MSNILQFIWFKDLINWSVNSYLSINNINTKYDLVKIYELLKQVKNQEILKDEVSYKLSGIHSHGKGLFHRSIKSGKDIKSRKLNKLQKNQFVYSRLGSHTGSFDLVSDEFNNYFVSNEVPTFEFINNNINPYYLQLTFLLKKYWQDIEKSLQGTAHKRFKEKDFLNLQVPLPPLEIQQQLVKNYQDKINLAKQQEQEAEQKIQEIETYLYKELGIELAKKEHQNKNILQFISFKDLNYWDYDKNCNKFSYTSIFNKVKLNDICDISRGGSPRPIQNFITNDKNGVNWIKIGDTKDVDKYIYKVKEKIRPEGVKYSRSVNKGDFILSNSMSFGKPYIMKTTGCIHDGWLLLRLYKNLINENYLYHILGSSFMFNMFSHSTIGTVVQNLNIQTVKITKIPLPPLKIQNKIAEHIQNIKNEIQVLKQQAEQNKKNALNEFEAEIFTNKMNMENNNAT
jgi:restriction endonuclease S subunit